MSDLTIICNKCKKSFILTQAASDYYQKQAQEKNEEVILPKYCDDCRLFREQLKSIPKKIQSICNFVLKDKQNDEVVRCIRLIFGLARKEMKQNLILFGFIKKE